MNTYTAPRHDAHVYARLMFVLRRDDARRVANWNRTAAIVARIVAAA